jgi:hypothetical protein
MAVSATFIQQAEHALAGGRLDEAGMLLDQAQARQQRRGQELLDELVAKLTTRARTHLLADRAEEALADCRVAQRLAGNLAEVATIRDAATAAMLADQRRQRRQEQVLSLATRQVAQGNLEAGERLIREASEQPLTQGLADRSAAVALLRDIDARRAQLKTACAAAEQALADDDADRAVAELDRLRIAGAALNGDGGVDERVATLWGRLRALLADRLADALDTGRLDLADGFANRLRRCGSSDAVGEGLGRVMDQCRTAWQWVQRGAPRQAGEVLRRVAQARPGARWVGEAIEQLQRAEQEIESLRSGALGLLAMSQDSPVRPTVPTPPAPPAALEPADDAAARPGPMVDPQPIGESILPDRFLLQVDGAGSFCVVTGATVTFGPVSSPRRPDVGLVVEPHTPLATIQRLEDDYFVQGETGVTVNDEPATSRLLQRGDRIALGPRCRVTFQLPHPSSTTATLDLSAARYPRADVRRAILLDQDLIIGPQAAHVRCGDLKKALALRWHGRRLLPPVGVEVRVGGQAWPAGAGLPMGVPIDLAGIRMALSRI